MNASIKLSLINPKSSFFHIKSAFFHSTNFLERGRRNYWNHKINNTRNNNRWSGHRKNHFKDCFMRHANAYVEYIFQGSNFDCDQDESGKGPSWFRKPQNGSRRNFSNTQGHPHKKGKRVYRFCEEEEDDDDVETIFRSAFGDQFTFWSFVNDDYPNGRNSSRTWYSSYERKTYWKQRRQHNDDDYEYEYEYTSEDNTKNSDLTSDRVALGLSASGPLKLDDVKNAYRACALKWHPDRHVGSSKVAAEEKFKLCTAAYQSLCDRLATN